MLVHIKKFLIPHIAYMHLVRCKWIFRIKYDPDGTIQRYKVRPIAKEFQKTTRVDYFETFSSILKVASIRIIMCLTIYFG